MVEGNCCEWWRGSDVGIGVVSGGGELVGIGVVSGGGVFGITHMSLNHRSYICNCGRSTSRG